MSNTKDAPRGYNRARLLRPREEEASVQEQMQLNEITRIKNALSAHEEINTCDLVKTELLYAYYLEVKLSDGGCFKVLANKKAVPGYITISPEITLVGEILTRFNDEVLRMRRQ